MPVVGAWAGHGLGRRFGWLWAAYAVSAFGTWLGFGAFPLIAILVLHAGPAEVSALAAAGLAVGAVVAVPLGPWVEFRRKRPVMIAMDLIRFAALMSVPAAFALGRLSFAQLLVVSVVVAAADIAFKAASGAYLKALVPPEDLLVANGRFESTTWTATALGPPLGGAAIGLFGPVTTVVADAVSYLLSALGIRAIGGTEPRPARAEAPRLRAGDLLDGWRYILGQPGAAPAVLQHGPGQRPDHGDRAAARRPDARPARVRALAVRPRLRRALRRRPDRLTAGAAGSSRGSGSTGPAHRRRAARVLAARPGLRPARRPRDSCSSSPSSSAWSPACGVFNPVFATYRLEHTATDRVARTLSAWSVTSNATIAALTALWGLLAGAHQPAHRDRGRRRADAGHPAAAARRAPRVEQHPHRPNRTLDRVTEPRRRISAWLMDMDGVLVHEEQRDPGRRRASSRRLRERGLPFLVLTNNSIYTRRDLAARLAASGLEVPEDAIWTSALATARFLEEQRPRGSAFVIGEAGLTTALHEAGYTLTERDPDYVVLGETRTYSFERITQAIRLIVDGARFIATNPDPTGPSPDGPTPATGSVAALISRATGVEPYYVGKPNPLMMRSALNALDAHSESAAMIGDRMDTDIVAGLEAGLEAVLVLTGVTARGETERYPYRPSRIVDSIADLVDELG